MSKFKFRKQISTERLQKKIKIWEKNETIKKKGDNLKRNIEDSAILGINSHAIVVVVSILPESAMVTPSVQTGPMKYLVGIEEKVSINLS